MCDINAEKPVRKHQFYYHVTSTENIDKILKAGLKANEEGHIFVFTDQKVAQDIAVNQCGLKQVALFMIDSRGITGKVIRDRVAEFAAPYHRIIIQKKISKRYIIFHRSWSIDLNNPTPWDLYKLIKFEKFSKKDAKRVFYERRGITQHFTQ